jgi:AhpD family alkylhydroperoxidase
MPRIPVHTVDSAPEHSRDTLKALEEKFGKVLNIHGEMAHSPVVIQAYAAMQRAVADHGSFDAKTREAIALVVGNVDDCAYCQSAHTGAAKAAGLSEEQTVAIREDQVDFDSKLAALLTLVRESTGNLGNVEQDTWQAALDAGWSDAELAETSAHVSVNMLTNHFNHLVGTELDIPAAPGL